MHRNLICISLASVNASLAKVIYDYETYFPTLIDATSYRALRPINMGSNSDSCWTELSCPMEDKKRTLHAIKEFQNLHQDNQIAGILCLVDRYMPLAAYLCRELALVGLSENTAALISNKYLLKRELYKAGIIKHPFARVKTVGEARAFGADNGYPIVIKPAIRSGGRGVIAVEKESDVDAAFANAAEYSGNEPVLAEVFLDGQEVSVEGVSFQNQHHLIGVTDKMVTPGPNFIEIGHTFPSRLSEGVLEQITGTVMRALETLSIMNCCWHIEIKLTSQGLVINEIHGRLPGGRITELIRLAAGIEMDFLAAATSLGDPIGQHHLRPKYRRTACIRYILQDEHSYNAVRNYFSVWRLPCVRDVRIYLSSGNERRDNFDRAGFIITEAETADEAERAIEKAMDTLKFV